MTLGLGLGFQSQQGRGFAPNDISHLLAWWDVSDPSTFTFHAGSSIGDATVDQVASKVGAQNPQAWRMLAAAVSAPPIFMA